MIMEKHLSQTVQRQPTQILGHHPIHLVPKEQHGHHLGEPHHHPYQHHIRLDLRQTQQVLYFV